MYPTYIMSLLPLSDATLTSELLYKKYLGVGDAKVGVGYRNEGLGSARPNVLYSQVWQVDIPLVAPVAPGQPETDTDKYNTDHWERVMSFTTVANPESEKWIYKNPDYLDSEKKPVLAYYIKAPLSSKYLDENKSFWSLEAADGNGLDQTKSENRPNNPGLNILRRAIPFNYDFKKVYSPKVYNLNVADRIIAADDSLNPWIFDSDSGFLTFWNKYALTPKIAMTFWRYEGPIGPGRSGGTGSTSTADGWSKYYLADPPPAVTVLTSKSQSTQVFLPWNKFDQINVGFGPNYLPATTGLNAYYNNGTNGTMLLNKLNTDIFDNTNYIGTPLISTLVLSKKPVSSPLQVVNPGTGAGYAYVIEQQTLLTTNNTMHVWFNNYNKGSNAVIFTFDGYLPAVAPSAPQGGSVSDPVQVGYTLNWTVPSETQKGQGNVDGVNIENYSITYSTPGDSTTRVGGADDDRITTAIITPNSTPEKLFNNLFPECVYTFVIKAANDVDSTLYSDALTYVATATPALTPTFWNGDATFGARYFGTVRKCAADTVDITSLIDTNIDWTSSNIAMILNDTSKRGINAGTNATITTLAITLNGTARAPVVFTGWPLKAVTNTADTNVMVTTNVADTYTDIGLQGYFLTGTTSITIKSASFVASNSVQTLAWTQTKTASPSNVSVTGSLLYYYDTILAQAPRIISVGIVLNTDTADYVQISGVFVIKTVKLIVTTVITAGDLGHYFYKNTMLDYTCSSTSLGTSISITPPSETTPNVGGSILTTGYDATNFVFYPSVDVTFVRPIELTTLLTGYATTTSASVNANNVKGNASTTSSAINAIIDGASVNLIKSIWPQSLPLLNAAGTNYGLRVACGTVGANFTLPLSYPTSTAYDNTMDIRTTQELQVAGGAIVTPSVRGYLNYPTYTYKNGTPNTHNYSTIAQTGYRFITFAWKVDTTVQRNKLKITLRNLITTPPVNVTSSEISIGSLPIYIYFRFEELDTNNNAFAPSGTSKVSSVWLDARRNSNGYSQHIGGDYFSPVAEPMGALNGVTKTINDYEILCDTLSVEPDTNVNFYIRIGLPMDAACSLQGVTPVFTTI